MKLTFGELKSMAGVAGIDMYTAWGVSDDALLEFTKAIVERCAVECDELAELNRNSPTDSMWEQEECAAAIRNLLED